MAKKLPCNSAHRLFSTVIFCKTLGHLKLMDGNISINANQESQTTKPSEYKKKVSEFQVGGIFSPVCDNYLHFVAA